MKLALICFSIALIGLSSAYFPGDLVNISNDLNRTDLVYTIIDNSTPITLDINLTENFVWFIIPYDIEPQSFTIIFLENQTNEIIKEFPVERVVYRGGGGTRYIEKEVNNTVYLNDTRYYSIEKECPEINSSEVPQEIEECDIKCNWQKYSLIEKIILGVIVILSLFGIFLMIKEYLKWRKNERNN